jgi:hypothetical protein
MRIQRNMLLKLADDTVKKAAASDRSLLAVYMQGSLLGESPLIGNTADIDLFFVHNDEVAVEREIVRISDEVHLDIAHHSHRLYRKPRALRIHPWLGPAIYGCKVMYDPQHFIDFVQASVRGQFSSPQNVISRVRQQAEHARQMWESLNKLSQPPTPGDVSLFLRAMEHAAQAMAGLSGANLTERRFLMELPKQAEAVGKPGLAVGFSGLLGAVNLDEEKMKAWLPDWRAAYLALTEPSRPDRLHPQRLAYYERAIEAMLGGSNPSEALWVLWHTWTDAMRALPDDAPQHEAWRKAGEQLGLLGASFVAKVKGLDAYLDQVEDLLDTWGRENGV